MHMLSLYFLYICEPTFFGFLHVKSQPSFFSQGKNTKLLLFIDDIIILSMKSEKNLKGFFKLIRDFSNHMDKNNPHE